MKIGILKETAPQERRVAATPDTAKRLRKHGFEVVVEQDAGAQAQFADAAYVDAGCEIGDTAKVWADADIVLKVLPPNEGEVARAREGQTVASFVWPAKNEALLKSFADKKANLIAMDAVPRISRAQKLDALSSMANVAGYRAVVEAAQYFPRFFTGQITAAGKVPPAKVMVIGAGVAGLAAIGAARGLGAIVRAFDTRPVVKEQVESMGAEFLELEFEEDGTGEGGYAKVMSEEFIAAEMELFRQQSDEVDIIITTALIPGRPAPKLILADMVERLRPGSVIVDLAAETGGNCELTEPGRVVVKHGVTIVGLTDLPSRMASQASQLYGMNLVHLMDEYGKAENFGFDFDNEIVRGATAVRAGEVTWPPPKAANPEPKKPDANAATPTPAAEVIAPKKSGGSTGLLVAGAALLAIGLGAPSSFLAHFTVFVLACFVGWQVIWNVSAALHTPLMSVTNAISGIILIGGILQISGPPGSATTLLGAAAILVATINIAGGFLVTRRMLDMFRKE